MEGNCRDVDKTERGVNSLKSLSEETRVRQRVRQCLSHWRTKRDSVSANNESLTYLCVLNDVHML